LSFFGPPLRYTSAFDSYWLTLTLPAVSVVKIAPWMAAADTMPPERAATSATARVAARNRVAGVGLERMRDPLCDVGMTTSASPATSRGLPHGIEVASLATLAPVRAGHAMHADFVNARRANAGFTPPAHPFAHASR